MKYENLKVLKEKGFNIPSFEVIKWEDRDKEIDISKFNGKYAVRSSSNLEDSKEHSFAGLFNTYLEVEPSDIPNKVKECFDSLNNNIDKYLNNRDIDINELKMDVIIQEMVDSEYSGILFSANPNGLLNESVIVVGEGLGNNVVEDKIDTTTYYYNLTDNVYYYDGDINYLDNNLINKLIDISKDIKKVLGEYIDIEFAIKNSEIYILQARPITTLDLDNVVVLDNSNIVESYPGVSLPLTISFVKYVYTNVFYKEAIRLTHNEKLVNDHMEQFNNMVGSSSGRIYYKITNWYTLLKFLPFSKKIIPIWQDMMGANISDKLPEVNIPIGTRIKTYYNTFRELKNVSKNMDILNNKFIEINKYFNEHFSENLTNEEIINLYNKVKDDILSLWDITLVNDLYAFIYTGILKKKPSKKHLSDTSVNGYISGISNIESLKPIKSMVNLAIKKDELSEIEYNKLFKEYIELYGDRNLEELKLESKTFRTNPELLEKRIEEYRFDLNKLKDIYNNLNKDNKEIKNGFIAKRAMIGIKNREISRLNRSRIYGMVRSLFLVFGNNLYKEGLLDNQRDIFYLSIEEIFNYKEYNIKDLVDSRKREYETYYKLPNYSRLVFSNKEFDKHARVVNNNIKEINKNVLEGTPTSMGEVEGYALVINDVTKTLDVKDKILITKMTDPGWVFLLATAKGVISEKGSILSHTAIISRELKIPGIVGVKDATITIKTGDYIKMNANTGKIEIVRRSNENN